MRERYLDTIELDFRHVDYTTFAKIPYFDGGVQAGFPSPANDFQELTISFDKLVFGTSPSTTFCAKVNGSSMKNAGIENGDIIVVDRSLKPENGNIAVCLIYDEFTLKRLHVEKNCVWLLPENDNYPPIQITDNESFQVWGIVTYTLKDHLNNKK